jgi:hypothetical protein
MEETGDMRERTMNKLYRARHVLQGFPRHPHFCHFHSTNEGLTLALSSYAQF